MQGILRTSGSARDDALSHATAAIAVEEFEVNTSSTGNEAEEVSNVPVRKNVALDFPETCSILKVHNSLSLPLFSTLTIRRLVAKGFADSATATQSCHLYDN
jgi:hypothetical protein